MSNEIDLEQLGVRLEAFARERDWGQFHSPKNLAMALAAEAGELLEIYQWLDPDTADRSDREVRRRTAEELADILIYAVRMADVLDIDLPDAVAQKIESNEARYPIGEVMGRAVKRP